MRKPQLEAALCAAAAAAGVNELILVGSQSVFACTDEVPTEVLISEECDVWAKERFESLSVLQAKLGRNSPYHKTHGVFVDPVEPNLLLLPTGWESRLKPMQVGSVTAWCLDVSDLVVSKLAAGRLKDYEFINAILRARLTDFDQVATRVHTFAGPHQQAVLLARLRISSETMP